MLVEAAILWTMMALHDAPPPAVPAIIKLKNGTEYSLQTPPHLTGGRFVFTASDGRVYSLSESDVDEVRLLAPTPDPRMQPNPQDSHDLGAIARQERTQKGKHTLIAPAVTPKPKKKSAPAS
jgi:hypothetical protein